MCIRDRLRSHIRCPHRGTASGRPVSRCPGTVSYTHLDVYKRQLLDCLECLLQIGDQVVGILGTDGQADGVLVDALVQQFLLAELAVGGGGRVDDQACLLYTSRCV